MLASSIAGNQIRVEITASPNPSHGIVTVTTGTPVGTSSTIKLFNAIGECINSFDVSSGENQSLTITGLSSGFYYLRLETSGNLAAMREFVVQQ
jgi:hypothetical protein